MEENYLPLFRKYRPQSFADVVGQESLVKALSNAIELNRIANAYLFCGPRGTGKTSSARILAKSLNCEHGPTLTPCQKCASCIDITNAAGLDVIEIDAASNRGIQDAKDLIAQVQYAPINGKYKIFIIDEVHMLSNDAFNALLKTFEEPPKNVIFILATTEPHKVLETIVSRCQRFDLRRITTSDITKRLREISDIENIKITSEALFTIAKNVSGGLRDSLALLDQVSILGVKEEIGKDLIEELLGKINLDILLKLLDNITKEDIENSLLTVDEIYSRGNEPRNLAENFIEFLRNIILVLNSKNQESIKNFTSLIDEDIEKIKSHNFDKDRIIKILNTFIEYYKEIKISTNPYLWTELACIASAKLDLAANINQNQKFNNAGTSFNSAQTINNQPQTIKQKALDAFAPIENSPANELQQTHADNQAPSSADIPKAKEQENQSINSQNLNQAANNSVLKNNQINDNAVENNSNENNPAQVWLDVIAGIPSLPTRALYSGTAKLVGVDNKKIILGFTHENALNQAKSPNKLNVLEKTIESLYPGYSLELIKITADTKVIEVKPNIAPKPQYQPQTSYQPQQNQQYPNQNIKSQVQQNSNQAYNSSYDNQSYKENSYSNPNSEDEEQSTKEKRHYSPKVQEMIEQFNGRIIED